jgi:DNA-binding transcriptional regulator YiaG
MAQSKRQGPNREQVAQRTIARLRRFSQHLDSGRPIQEAYSCRKVILDVHPQPHTAAMVKETRTMLRVSQALFAKFLRVKVATVQKWERHGAKDGPACLLMDEIRSDPEWWRERFMSMARWVKSPPVATAPKP